MPLADSGRGSKPWKPIALKTRQGRRIAGPVVLQVLACLYLGINRQMPVRVIAVFPLVEEPAIRPDLGGAEDLRAGPQNDADRFVVEYER